MYFVTNKIFELKGYKNARKVSVAGSFNNWSENALTMEKTWRAPYTENLITWVCGLVASVFGLLAVGSMEVRQLIFPVYSVLITLLMVGLLDYRRQWRKKRIRAGLLLRTK